MDSQYIYDTAERVRHARVHALCISYQLCEVRELSQILWQVLQQILLQCEATEVL